MSFSTTKTDDRAEWRARIQRALAELQSDAPTIDRKSGRDDREADGSSSASADI